MLVVGLEAVVRIESGFGFGCGCAGLEGCDAGDFGEEELGLHRAVG